MLYPDNIEDKIDFSFIRNLLNLYCSSSLGKEHVDSMSFISDYKVLIPLLGKAQEMKNITDDASMGFPHGQITDMREVVSKIRIAGLFLDETELDQLRHTLAYAVELESFFRALDPQRFPLLSELGESQMSELSKVVKMIDGILDKYARLLDSASAELGRIRKELAMAQGSVARVLSQIIRKAQADGIIDKDATPTLREGRLVIPVPPSYKRKIGGIVHDESATGKTVYIEPQQAVEANNRIRELEGEERRERVRILQEIALRIQPFIPLINASATVLGEVDFLLAKSRLATDLQAICPQIEPLPMIDLHEAKHPILYLNFKKQNKSVVPLTLRLTDKRILVISGPNAGGKSVCLKTVALLQYMLQCGLLVPVHESSTMGMFEHIMIDIGDEQSINDDLSTYSSHLRNMKTFVRSANATTLFLIDEFGTGTEPLIGGAIAESVLEDLTRSMAFGIITTHYTNIKHFAEQHNGVVNGAMLYDRGQLKPLFQLSVGQAGSSFAVEIARQIGLPTSIIEHATAIIGEQHIDYDKQLQDIARDKRYWEQKRQSIRQKEKQLDERIAQYEEQMAGIKAKRKEVIAQAAEEAAALLEKSNATIERTIREIKEAKAEKERTKAARQKIEQLKEKVDNQKQTKNLSKKKNNQRTHPATESMRPKQIRDFRDLRFLTKDPARYLSDSQPRKQQTVVDEMRRRKLSFSRQLDLRGMRADEALEALIAYMDDAIMVAAEEITILHGTGTGALKQITREYLKDKSHQMQKRKTGSLNYHDGDPDRGGAGLTIVELS